MTTYPNYDPTALFAGEGSYRSRPISIAQALAVTPRGTLLGRSSIATGAGAAVVAAANGNTGNGTIAPDATSPVLANAQPGVYTVKFTGATTFDVLDPKGTKLGSGAIGATPYADRLKFVAAAGATAFVAGDSFSITVAALDIYVPCVATAIDGSQVPAAVVAADTDTTAGAVTAPAYFDGTFAFEEMTVDPSWSYTTLRAALRQMGSQLDVRSVGQLG